MEANNEKENLFIEYFFSTLCSCPFCGAGIISDS